MNKTAKLYYVSVVKVENNQLDPFFNFSMETVESLEVGTVFTFQDDTFKVLANDGFVVTVTEE